MSNKIAKGVRVIRPYKKEPANMRTLEGSLYQNGYTFIPGTVRKFYPRVDSRGVIRTGLDENSPKFRGILNSEAVKRAIGDKELAQVIVRAPKLVNIATK